MSTKAIVLLSGGLDSVFNLYKACELWPGEVAALSINYGQRAWPSEERAAKHFSEELQVPLQSLQLAEIFIGDRSSLTSMEQEVPTQQVDIESLARSQQTAQKVWVSNRNGVLLNVAACRAEMIGAQWIVPGFNAEEAATFPDNSVDFIEKMNACLQLSTANGVQIRCFSQTLYKAEMAQYLVEKGVAMEQVWSCYFAGEQPCQKCESCQRFRRALQSTKQ